MRGRSQQDLGNQAQAVRVGGRRGRSIDPGVPDSDGAIRESQSVVRLIGNLENEEASSIVDRASELTRRRAEWVEGAMHDEGRHPSRHRSDCRRRRMPTGPDVTGGKQSGRLR